MPYAVMNTSKPRPILKRASVSGPTVPTTVLPAPEAGAFNSRSGSGNGVHFPPHAILASTHIAYSADAYDRSPIAVMPNECALPARGCPGRTYLAGAGDESAIMDDDDDDDDDGAFAQSTPGRAWQDLKNEQAHPRARVLGFEPSYRYNSGSPSSGKSPFYASKALELLSDALLSLDSSRSASTSRSDSPARTSPSRHGGDRNRAPSLIPDFSSDASEDSDHSAFAPFLNGTFASMPMSYHATEPGSRNMTISQNSDPAQLAFLPHPRTHHHPQTHNYTQAQAASYPYQYSAGASSAPMQGIQTSVPSPVNRTKARGSPIRTRRPSVSVNTQGFSDEGCLGGF